MNRTELMEVLGCDPHDDLSDTELLEAVLENLVYTVEVCAPFERDQVVVARRWTPNLMSDGKYLPEILQSVCHASQDFLDVDVDLSLGIRSQRVQSHAPKILEEALNLELQRQRQYRFDNATRLWTKEVQDLEAMKSELKEGAYESRKSALERRKPVLEKS